MCDPFSRTERLLGKEAMGKLAASRVAVFGIGGVGGYTVEALIRSGVGSVDLIDHDRVSVSNINRQIYATQKTVGQYKVDVAAQRIGEINPDAHVRTFKTFYTPETAAQFDFSQYDYIVDAIDTVSGKIALVEHAYAAHTPIISSMGAGNKIDPTAFEVADIFSTSVCPLAKVMRHELRRRGIPHLKVVYSKEVPLVPMDNAQTDFPAPNSSPETEQAHTRRRQVPGSTAFVPSVAGLILAGEVVKDLIHADTNRIG